MTATGLFFVLLGLVLAIGVAAMLEREAEPKATKPPTVSEERQDHPAYRLIRGGAAKRPYDHEIDGL